MVSTFAIELAALDEAEFAGLERYLAAAPALPFHYVSVHAPVKGRVVDEHTLVRWLKRLPAVVDAIIMHPDTIEEPAVFRVLGRRLVLENMDSRKERGTTATELGTLFDELPDAGFCFDIAHAWSVDPDMIVAAELLDRFRARLREVHLSSLREGRHVPLTREHAELFEPSMRRCLDVPWILEAPWPHA